MFRKRKPAKNASAAAVRRFSTQSRLAQLVIIFFCAASVGLNVFLLLNRKVNLELTAKSEAGNMHPVVYDSWVAGIEPNRKAPVTNGNLTKTQTNEDSAMKHRDTESKSVSIKQYSKPRSKPPEQPKTQKGNVSLCPFHPKGLVSSVRALHKKITPEELQKKFPEMEKGGRIRPQTCVSRQRLAIIIPFRNRHEHLHILLHNLIPFLKRQMATAAFFVIEQAPPSTFNRGALLNIGFLEAQKIDRFDCFLLHDVDLIPINDNNFYRCGKNPHHFSVAINKYKFKLKYEGNFGGVVGFSKEQFIKVNGNSNLYFGWGGEDDELELRISNKNYTIERYDKNISRYLMIKHEIDKGNDKNIERRHIMKSAKKRQDIEGLNTTKYKVNSIKFHHLYTWINVSIEMKDVLEVLPSGIPLEIIAAQPQWMRFLHIPKYKMTAHVY